MVNSKSSQISWIPFKILLGMKIALAEYPMIEKQSVLFVNSRMSLCPWKSLLCGSSKRILCVFSCIFHQLFVSLMQPYILLLTHCRRRGVVCQKVHTNHASSSGFHHSLKGYFVQQIHKHFTDSSLKRDFLHHERELLLNYNRLHSHAYFIPSRVFVSMLQI